MTSDAKKDFPTKSSSTHIVESHLDVRCVVLRELNFVCISVYSTAPYCRCVVVLVYTHRIDETRFRFISWCVSSTYLSPLCDEDAATRTTSTTAASSCCHTCALAIPRAFYSLHKCVFIFSNKFVTSLFCALVQFHSHARISI